RGDQRLAGRSSCRPSPPVACGVYSIGAPPRAVNAAAVARAVDEDLDTRFGLALADPLGPDIGDELRQLARDQSSQPPLQRRSHGLTRNERQATAAPADDRGTLRHVAEKEVQSRYELVRRRRADDVTEAFAQHPAATKGVLGGCFVDAVRL